MTTVPAAKARFDIRFLEKPPDDCLCPICLSVMNDPHLTSCCGQHYCQACITRIQSMNQPCPICKEEEFTTLFDRQLRNRISVLHVYCPMENNGCKWHGKYEDLESHLSVGKVKGECLYISVACPFGCEHSYPRRHLTKHMAKECENRHDQCQMCYDCGVTCGRKQHHSNCPNRPINCPNGCPIPNIRFCKVEEHINQLCPYREVDCKFRIFGCTATMKFKDGPRHQRENMCNHLEYIRQFAVNHSDLDEIYVQLVQKNADLEKEHQELEQKVADLELRCESYEASLSELRKMIQSLKESAEHAPTTTFNSARDSWVLFSPPALSTQPASEPLTPDPEKDPFCFRP